MEIKKYKAFTLIELLVVITILGILYSVAMPRYDKFILKKRFDEAKVTLQALMLAQDKYRIEYGHYLQPIGSSAIKNEQFIADELKIDLSSSANFVYSVETTDNNATYTLRATLRPYSGTYPACTDGINPDTACAQETKHNRDSWVFNYIKNDSHHYIRVRYPELFDESETNIDHVENGFDYTHIYTGL